MTGFSVGDQVIIRYGRQQGQKGKIIKSQRADVYEVRIEDGSVLFFSGKGLDKEPNDSNRAQGRLERGNSLAQEQTTPLGRRPL
jgi:hypothetical protein